MFSRPFAELHGTRTVGRKRAKSKSDLHMASSDYSALLEYFSTVLESLRLIEVMPGRVYAEPRSMHQCKQRNCTYDQPLLYIFQRKRSPRAIYYDLWHLHLPICLVFKNPKVVSLLFYRPLLPTKTNSPVPTYSCARADANIGFNSHKIKFFMPSVLQLELVRRPLLGCIV